MVSRLAGLALCGGAVLAWTGQEPVAPSEGMLLSALEGHRYERVSYDAEGRVEERATIDIGALQFDGTEVSVPLDVEVHKDGTVARRFSTRWTCARRGGDMMMAVLVFSDDLDKPSMRLETAGTPLIYPREVPASGALPAVSVEVKVRQGFLCVLGARTRITLADRRIAPPDGGSPRRRYTIKSRVELRAYALGIRVRRVRYTSEETVDPREGILQHILRRDDGSYSALRRLD